MKIINFSSHSATWYFAFAEASILYALKTRGHDVLYISAGKTFGEKSSIMQENIIRNKFGLAGYTLDKLLTKKNKKEISYYLKKITPDNYETLIIEGINIGKIALYEFLLNRKNTDLNFSQSEWSQCKVNFKNTLYSVYACKSMLNKENPDVVLIYNTLYSVNRVWELLCDVNNTKVYFLHAGLNLGNMDYSLMVAKGNPIHYYKHLKNIWHYVKEIPISQKNIINVTTHFMELLKATHYLVYSTPKSKEHLNIRKIFKIKNSQKILTATMSSYDEIFTAQYVGAMKKPTNLIFKNQIEWIKQLTKFVKNRSDLFLIIRIHPREFPNKRENVKSNHISLIKEAFRNLPVNVHINWPTDGISIYDLCQYTDVFLNAWSSVGVGMSLLGIPVVIYTKDLIFYPSELNLLARSKKDYFRLIDQALMEGWSYERSKYAYRWLSLLFTSSTIMFRNPLDKKFESEITKNSKFFCIKDKIYKLLPTMLIQRISPIFAKIPFSGVGKKQTLDCINQSKINIDLTGVENMFRLSSNSILMLNKLSRYKPSCQKEDLQLRIELGKIYRVLFKGKSSKSAIKNNTLEYNLKKVSRI